MQYWEQITSENPTSGRFYAQLGDSYYRLKQYSKAIAAFKKEMEIGYRQKATVAYNIACNYALAGEKKEALDWLEKSLALGYTNLEHAKSDSDFVTLHKEARFKKLLFIDDVSKLTRVQGWNYDLHMMAWEAQRKAFKESQHQDLPHFLARLKSIGKEVPKLSDAQIIVELMKIMPLLGDGHSGMYQPLERKEFNLTYPVRFYQISEGLFVISADPKYKELLGCQVIQFENSSVTEVRKKIDPLVTRDNEMMFLERTPYLMRYPILLKTPWPRRKRRQGQSKNTKARRLSSHLNYTCRYDSTEYMKYTSKPGWMD